MKEERILMRAIPFVVAGMVGLGGVVLATTPPEPDFPILGGSFGQMMRVTVSAVPPDPCRVVVQFHTNLTSPPDADRVLDLAPGQVGAADLDLSRLAPRFGARVEIQPIVHVLAGRCSAAAETFEVFTRRTTAYLRLFTGLSAPPDPDSAPPDPEQAPPDPEFAAITPALGQIAQLGITSPPEPENVNTLPPDPCRGTLMFLDAAGQTVGNATPFDLSPGQFAFASVDPRSSLGSVAPSPRTILQPRVVADSPGSLAGCHASVQVFDALTGWTTQVVGGR